MFAQLTNGYVIDVIRGVVDPAATRRICEPMAKTGGNNEDIADKKSEVREFNNKLHKLINDKKKVEKSPMLKQLKRNKYVSRQVEKLQENLIGKYKEEHEILWPKYQNARRELKEMKEAYEERRKGIYKDNAVLIAPGGCVPIDDDNIKAFKKLKDGYHLRYKRGIFRVLKDGEPFIIEVEDPEI